MNPESKGVQRKKLESLILIGAFLGILFAVSLWNVLTADQNFSEQENRVLSQRPELSTQSLLSGEFMRDYETYLSDQFAGKVAWTTLKAQAEQWQGKREVEGIFLADDGYLLEKFPGEAAQFSQNITYIQKFSERNETRHVSLMLAPTSIEFYQDKLPLFAETASQKKWLEKANKQLGETVRLIDVHATLERHKDQPVFFRTDHHWTMTGAYYAYREAAATLGFEPYELSDFTSEAVSTTFMGTHASKVVGFPVEPDTIDVWYPEFPTAYSVTYPDTGEVRDSLYDYEQLQKRDQYSFFLGGNHRLLTIHSQVDNGRKLAVIKDSYAHVLLPFLANHYEEVHVIDLRYFHSGLEAYLQQNAIQDVVFVYNLPNFMNDSNLIWLKS